MQTSDVSAARSLLETLSATWASLRCSVPPLPPRGTHSTRDARRDLSALRRGRLAARVVHGVPRYATSRVSQLRARLEERGAAHEVRPPGELGQPRAGRGTCRAPLRGLTVGPGGRLSPRRPSDPHQAFLKHKSRLRPHILSASKSYHRHLMWCC